jgi:hypothetical protein
MFTMNTMEKPKTVKALEDFLSIYAQVRKTAFAPYERIRAHRLNQLPKIDRLIVGSPMLLNMLVLGTAVVLVCAGAVLFRRSGYSENDVKLYAMNITVFAQLTVFLIMWRQSRFKSSPTGEYRFYIEAKRLKEKYEEHGYGVPALRLALDRYISNKNAGFALFAGSAAALALYLEIDDTGFGGSVKFLRRAFEIVLPFNQTTWNRPFFLVLYTAGFIYALGKFYFPRIWAEQIKQNLEHICSNGETQSSTDAASQ